MRARAWLAVLMLVLLSAAPAARRWGRAAGLLLRFGGEEAPAWLTGGAAAVTEELITFDAPRGPTRGRIYRPAGVADPPAVVLAHGVHRLGIEEPRLTRFARAVAASGVVVMTPQIDELADYQIMPESVGTIGAAVVDLGRRVGRGRVGVMGFSFAGGLSLVTAADQRFRDRVAFVVSIGGHQDLARVARFFVEHKIDTVEGGTLSMHAHDYGLLVLLYGYTPDFFSPADAPGAHEALRLWLAGDQTRARQAAAPLSDEGRRLMDLIFTEKGDTLAPRIKEVLAGQKEKMARVSPLDLHAIEADVFVLHGSGDNVIPPSEALWLARKTPPARLRAALVSDAIQHVELHGKPSWVEQARVVDFMASLIEAASREPRAID